MYITCCTNRPRAFGAFKVSQQVTTFMSWFDVIIEYVVCDCRTLKSYLCSIILGQSCNEFCFESLSSDVDDYLIFFNHIREED
ncbi:hypothetical protein RIF29_13000 [Crotalaria pallida]|uniref:Uncharacterized protein n=1 Tax=Crotalaria pallida TaxID=3830 RepID=A0AAN9INT0_CROPI